MLLLFLLLLLYVRYFKVIKIGFWEIVELFTISLLLIKLITMDTDIFEQMTDKDIKEYLEEQEADIVLSSLEWQEMDYVDCALPA